MGIKESLINLLPKPAVALFARPYIGGYTMPAVMNVVQELFAQGILSTLDLLGEDVTDRQKALDYKNLYLTMLEETAQLQAPLNTQTSVSIKMSSLTQVKKPDPLTLDQGLLDESLHEILTRSHELKIPITIDMEDHHWTTFTLETYKRYLKQGYDLGTVLQTCLNRTGKDIDELPDNARIRLCIGIYQEPSNIALIDKQAMKERLISWGEKLLQKGIHTELATHDETVIQYFVDQVLRSGKYPFKKIEFQMLLGVPRTQLQQELVTGTYREGMLPIPVRLYVPYAPNKSDAMAYCKRRLQGNPSIVLYGVQNIVKRLFY